MFLVCIGKVALHSLEYIQPKLQYILQKQLITTVILARDTLEYTQINCTTSSTLCTKLFLLEELIQYSTKVPEDFTAYV